MQNRKTPLPSTTPLRFGYDVPEGGEANTSINKDCFGMENQQSHHASSPLPIILSGATRSLGSEDEGGKRRAEPVEAGGGIGAALSLSKRPTLISSPISLLPASCFKRKKRQLLSRQPPLSVLLQISRQTTRGQSHALESIQRTDSPSAPKSIDRNLRSTEFLIQHFLCCPWK